MAESEDAVRRVVEQAAKLVCYRCTNQVERRFTSEILDQPRPIVMLGPPSQIVGPMHYHIHRDAHGEYFDHCLADLLWKMLSDPQAGETQEFLSSDEIENQAHRWSKRSSQTTPGHPAADHALRAYDMLCAAAWSMRAYSQAITTSEAIVGPIPPYIPPTNDDDDDGDGMHGWHK